MIRLLLLSFLCFTTAFSSAQKTDWPAVLVRLIDKDHPTEAEIDSLLTLSNKYLFAQQDTCLLLAQRAVDRAKRWYPQQAAHGNSLLILGDAHVVRSEWAECEAALEEGQAIFRQLDMMGKVAKADLKFSNLYRVTEEYEKTLHHGFSALDTWLELKDTSNIFRPYFDIANAFALLGQPDKALEYNAEALRWGRVMESGGIIRVALGNQAETEKLIAADYSTKADTSAHPAVYRDSMRMYQDRALASITESLALIEGGGNKYRLAICLNAFADLQTDRGEYEEALQHAQRAGEEAKALNSNELILQNKLILARLHRLAGRPRLTVVEATAALALPKAEENAFTFHGLHQELYLAHKDLGELAKALPHYETYIDYKRENESVERTEAVSEIEAKYQTARKEKQLLELGLRNEEVTRQRNYLMIGAGVLVLLGFLAFQLSRVRRERDLRVEFTQALIDGQEDERKRIARDLHDGIGQSLLVIKRQLDASQSASLENRNLISSTLEEVRSISRDLHPVLLEKFGITATIKDIISRLAANEPNLFITSDIADLEGVLEPKAEVQLFRGVQEALSNIVKHARATAAKVSIKHNAGEVKVVIQDNGQGFDHDQVKATSRSLGLRTMSERMTSVGGAFSVIPGEQSGTVVELRLPVKE